MCVPFMVYGIFIANPVCGPKIVPWGTPSHHLFPGTTNTYDLTLEQNKKIPRTSDAQITVENFSDAFHWKQHRFSSQTLPVPVLFSVPSWCWRTLRKSNTAWGSWWSRVNKQEEVITIIINSFFFCVCVWLETRRRF